ncbi:hypothetical protein BD413DRAFT_561289 [Trametes elegans]|nr:hypothetical protein BD413DRAFT_561289 [Trametes elegans]
MRLWLFAILRLRLIRVLYARPHGTPSAHTCSFEMYTRLSCGFPSSPTVLSTSAVVIMAMSPLLKISPSLCPIPGFTPHCRCAISHGCAVSSSPPANLTARSRSHVRSTCFEYLRMPSILTPSIHTKKVSIGCFRRSHGSSGNETDNAPVVRSCGRIHMDGGNHLDGIQACCVVSHVCSNPRKQLRAS